MQQEYDYDLFVIGNNHQIILIFNNKLRISNLKFNNKK